MKIRIYQIDTDRDANGAAFMPLDRLERIQGTEEVDASLYKRVFEGEVEEDGLEGVWALFNTDRPEGFTGRSLSVSDVVRVLEGPPDPGAYYCDTFSFRKIPFREDLARPAEGRRSLRVLMVEPGREARPAVIGGELEDLQAAVGGLIEAVYPFDENVCLVCNDEGKILGMDPNRGLFDDRGNLYDVICGPFFVCGTDGPDFVSLTEEQMERYEERFRLPERFWRSGRQVMAVPCAPWRGGEAR